MFDLRKLQGAKPAIYGAMSQTDYRAHNRTLSPMMLIAKQIAEVLADGHPFTEFRVIEGPGTGIFVAKTAVGKSLGVRYDKCNAESTTGEVVPGWRFTPKVKHQVFASAGMIPEEDLHNEAKRKAFIRATGQRNIEMAKGASLDEDKPKQIIT